MTLSVWYLYAYSSVRSGDLGFWGFYCWWLWVVLQSLCTQSIRACISPEPPLSWRVTTEHLSNPCFPRLCQCLRSPDKKTCQGLDDGLCIHSTLSADSPQFMGQGTCWRQDSQSPGSAGQSAKLPLLNMVLGSQRNWATFDARKWTSFGADMSTASDLSVSSLFIW